MRHLFYLLTIILFLFGPALSAQETERHLPHFYQEEPDDPYIPTDRSKQARTPAYTYQQSNIFTIQVNIDENGQNIVNDAANEPSLAIDPTNPSRMAIGWRQFDDITNNFRQAGYAYTEDGGISWTFPGVIEAGVFRSDPVLDFNKEGTFYYNSLTSSAGDFSCDVFSSHSSEDWADKVYAYGGDKQWMVVDRSDSNGEGNIYAAWKAGLSACTPGDFTRSIDEGASYESCSLIPGGLVRGTMSVGPDGTVYSFGEVSDGFGVAFSNNAQNAEEVVSWQYRSVNMLGNMYYYDGPNPSGMLGQAWVATDHSSTSTHGNVYVLSSLAPTNVTDPLEVRLSRSEDGGDTWSSPVRVNDDEYGNWQWFGTLSVAPNGRIDVTWLDTREDFGNIISALFYSYSLDGGITFSPNEKLSELFDPHLGWPNQQKIGDYMHSISTNEGVHLAWAATFNGEQDVYYSFITPDIMSHANTEEQPNQTFDIFPNPSSGKLQIQYELMYNGNISLDVITPSGKLLYTLVDEQQTTGQYNIKLNNHLPAGMYYCRLRQNNNIIAIKKLVIY
ncbi:MAG: T9SS type A sorting domain-containing protein [Chitinophagales bacterium]|nr:T9SS type A sorting domain-containing protein [Chitinophagales bacterium]